MRLRVIFLPLLTAALLTACAAETPEQAGPPDEAALEEEEIFELVEYLFVQHAEGVTLQDGVLTLEQIGDDVLYFSDRPHRIVGRESLEEFLDAWHQGEESFAEIPPNAVLTVKQEDQLKDLTVVLKDPVLTDRTLVYEVEVLDGPDSGSGDHAALFIDAFLKKALKREAGRAKRLGGRVRDGAEGFMGRGGGSDRDLPREPGGRGGGDRDLPREPGGRGGGDRDLPRDPSGGGGVDRDLPREPGMGDRRARGGSREVRRRGGRGEPEIR